MMFLGHDFSDEGLLREALTVPSYKIGFPGAKDNQRLEFLGDAVLGLVAAEMLYSKMSGRAEGELTVSRSHMVSTPSLCEAAAEVGLAAKLRVNGSSPFPAENSKTIADAVEAVIGAAYLDGGMDAARKVFASLGLSKRAVVNGWKHNPKGELQIRAQAMHPPKRPVYETLETAGQAHAPLFTVKVSVEGVGEAVAKGGSRKEAEALAAAKLLENMV